MQLDKLILHLMRHTLNYLNYLQINYGMPIITIPINEGSHCFRSRSNVGNNDFLNICDLSYPPRNCVKKYSRVNTPIQQVFYCSDNYEANITKLMPYWLEEIEIGETFAITTSVWQLKKSLPVAIIPDFENDQLMNLLKLLPKLNQGTIEREYWDYINSFFRLQGFYQPDIYKFTSAFCNAIIKNYNSSDEVIHGILYTSIQHLEAWNLAISTDYVDESLELKDVFKMYITKRGIKNGKPEYDNFRFSKQIQAKHLDNLNQKIIW